MKEIEVFYQCESVDNIEHIEVDAGITLGVVKEILSKQHGLTPEFRLFFEDGDEPADEDALVSEFVTSIGLKLHLSRCHEVKARVHYSGQTAEKEFAPGITIDVVRRWAAESEFGISKADASDFKLQLVNTDNRPSANRHVGAFAKCPDCVVEFDLVPDERIQG